MFSIKVVIAIGTTGVGKSSLLNSLCGKELFKHSRSMDSCTDRPTGKLAEFKTSTTHEKIVFIDFPGLGDSNERDV